MTLCIAAISRRGDQIVTVSDLMLSTSFTSQEADLKATPLTRSNLWIVMFAGSPSVRDSVVGAVSAALAKRPETLPEVMGAFRTACQQELKVKIEDEILSPLGLDRDRFLRRGRTYFGEEDYSRLLRRIEATTLETEFLVAGVDPTGKARIFSVSEIGRCTRHDSPGFHAIGSGWVSAIGALYGTYRADLSLTDLIYRACEAKFLGESASGVGKYTMVLVTDRDCELLAIIPEAMEPIREAWEQFGRPPVPDAAQTAIEQRLLRFKIYS
jgi:hypothetical protein